MADYRLGIDFGTSTTVACLRWPDGRTRPLLFDGSPMLPSAVYLDEGRLLVGRDALHSARVQPARFEPNPKQRVDEGAVLLGSDEVAVTDLVAAVLRRVGVEASTVTGGVPMDVTLAYPAAWAEHRRRVLLDAAHAAGLVEPVLVAEPIAAASYFDAVVRDRNRPPGNLVVYDLGAGTFDVSVVARGPAGFEVRVTDGMADIGGLDIDAAIVGFLGALSDDLSEDLEQVWTRLEQPATAADMRARRQLWDDVRTAKEMLSRSASTMIYVPLVEKDVPLGRAQFERLVRPLLERTVATTKSAIRRAALPETVPLDVFLVGGASRVPLIATLLHRALGVAPTVIEQPELAVAEGCLVTAVPSGQAGPGGPAGPPGTGYGAPGQPVSGAGPAAAPVSGPSGGFPAVTGQAPPGYGPGSPAYGPTSPAYGPGYPAYGQNAPVSGHGPGAPAYSPNAPVSGPGGPVFGPSLPSYQPPPGAHPHPVEPPGQPGRPPGQPDGPLRAPRIVGPRPGQQQVPVARPWHRDAPGWTALVQVLDLAVGESAGFTMRCYLPADDPDEDPDAVFLTSDGRLLIFDELTELVDHVRRTNAHDLAGLTDWQVVSRSIDPVSAEQYTVEAYELDLILANVGHGMKEWSPDLFVAARDLAVELANALDLRPVLKAFSGGSLLDQVDDTMRVHQGRRASQWWKDRRLSPDEAHAVRETWRRVVTIIETGIWPT